MSKEGVDVELPAVDYEVLTLMAKKVGKTPSELAVEMIRDFLDDPDKAMKELRKEFEKAKRLGLTLDEYFDRKMEHALKELKG